MKLSSVTYSRWILELLKNLLLVKFDSTLKSDPTTKKIKAAWVKFFDEISGSGDERVVNARKQILEMISQSSAMVFNEVRRIQTAPGTRSNIITKTWIGKRSTELYFNYSSIIHNLRKINWMWDSESLKTVLNFLPHIKDSDRDLISIFYTVLTELFPEELEEKKSDEN